LEAVEQVSLIATEAIPATQAVFLISSHVEVGLVARGIRVAAATEAMVVAVMGRQAVYRVVPLSLVALVEEIRHP
jgi:hypothetical protein